jgi:hypothetical protein
MQLSMIWEETMAEEFLAELFSIPRPNLVSTTFSQQSQAVTLSVGIFNNSYIMS